MKFEKERERGEREREGERERASERDRPSAFIKNLVRLGASVPPGADSDFCSPQSQTEGSLVEKVPMSRKVIKKKSDPEKDQRERERESNDLHRCILGYVTVCVCGGGDNWDVDLSRSHSFLVAGATETSRKLRGATGAKGSKFHLG